MTDPPGTDGTGPGSPPRIRPYLTPGGGSPRPAEPAAVPPAPDDPYGPLIAPTGLRPYVLTAGRVQSTDATLSFETQVFAAKVRPVANLSPERAAIIALCAEPLSVAEIAAKLKLHLGVTRILVGDLRAAGLVHVNVVDNTRPHTPETILRVMRGLRAIS